MRKTLAEARKDKRVYEIVRYTAGDGFDEPCYCINLEDGYEFEDGSCTQYVKTVKDIWECLDNEIIEIEEAQNDN